MRAYHSKDRALSPVLFFMLKAFFFNPLLRLILLIKTMTVMIHYKPAPITTVEPKGVPVNKKPVFLIKKYKVNPDGTIALSASATWDFDKPNGEGE